MPSVSQTEMAALGMHFGCRLEMDLGWATQSCSKLLSEMASTYRTKKPCTHSILRLCRTGFAITSSSSSSSSPPSPPNKSSPPPSSSSSAPLADDADAAADNDLFTSFTALWLPLRGSDRPGDDDASLEEADMLEVVLLKYQKEDSLRGGGPSSTSKARRPSATLLLPRGIKSEALNKKKRGKTNRRCLLVFSTTTILQDGFIQEHTFAAWARRVHAAKGDCLWFLSHRFQSQ